MNKKECEVFLINYLLDERNVSIKEVDYSFLLYRSLVNIRDAKPIDKEFINIQNQYLSFLYQEKKIINYNLFDKINDVYLIQGDITTLKVDCIVNAANKYLLGCFIPNHGCIDNAIHTFAGVELREACNEIMIKQGHSESNGVAKITNGFNLPCKKIIHTVGPIVNGNITKQNELDLRSCYESCIKLAIKKQMRSIALCCISTGEFCYPNEEAAIIAIDVCMKYKNDIDIIFNVFKDEDYEIYNRLLKKIN